MLHFSSSTGDSEIAVSSHLLYVMLPHESNFHIPRSHAVKSTSAGEQVKDHCRELEKRKIKMQYLSRFLDLYFNKISHLQTSRLLTSSLSLGVPVPRPTQCVRGV